MTWTFTYPRRPSGLVPIAKAAAPKVSALAFQRALHRVADSLTPGLARLFLKAVDTAKGQFDQQQFIRAVEEGRIGDAIAAVPLDGFSSGVGALQAPLTGVYQRAAEITAATTTRQVGIEILFDRANPQAIAWAREHAAELVTEVTDTTRAALNEAITTAVESGMSPARLARQIREMIGLTSQQVSAVENFRARLEGEGVTGETLEGRVERYAQAQVRQRAEVIAANESITAANTGSTEVYRQAQEKGWLPKGAQRKFQVAHDERLCPYCEEMDGQVVGITEPFVSKLLGQEFLVPHIHVSCRCTAALVLRTV